MVASQEWRPCRMPRQADGALNITTRAAWGKRLKGDVEPKISEARAVESVFAEYGIKEVWGAE